MRFAFFLLLVINAALGVHIWLSHARGADEDPRKREINPDAMKVVAIADPKVAASTAARVNAAKQLAESVAAGACIEFSVKSADAEKVQKSLAELNLGDRLTERKLEEVNRWWVFIPPANTRAAADSQITSLKRQGVKDISLQADNGISLGVFSSEEAAAKVLSEVQGKGAKGAQKAPRASQVTGQIFTVREPDTALVARFTLLSADMPDSTLKAAACAAPSSQPAKS
ncbi:MAG: hypothetical protein JNM76_09280 [Betaproteobacteria bacterium]|nr:hypothetical protein [Betaproteobacteria bacterium]